MRGKHHIQWLGQSIDQRAVSNLVGRGVIDSWLGALRGDQISDQSSFLGRERKIKFGDICKWTFNNDRPAEGVPILLAVVFERDARAGLGDPEFNILTDNELPQLCVCVGRDGNRESRCLVWLSMSV